MKFHSSVTVATVDLPPPWETRCSMATVGRKATCELVDFRSFQLLGELPGVGGHRVEEAALAFGEEDVEGKGGFAGT